MRTAGSGERANPGIYFLAAEAAAFTAGAALTAGLLFFFTAAAALGSVLPAVTADTLAAGVLDTAATAGAAAFAGVVALLPGCRRGPLSLSGRPGSARGRRTDAPQVVVDSPVPAT